MSGLEPIFPEAAKIIASGTASALSSAISKGKGPIRKFLDTLAEAHYIRSISSARADAEIDVLRKYKDFLDEVGNQGVLLSLICVARQKELNLLQIIELAKEKLLGTSPNDKALDDDWSTYFRHKAEEISNPNFQEVWSKILSAEIQEPGTISKRTLHDLFHLSQQEAKAFQKACSLCIKAKFDNEDIFVPKFMVDHLNKSGDNKINWNDVVLISDAGLTFSKTDLYFGSEGHEVYTFGGLEVNVRSANPEDHLVIEGVGLSKTGKELYYALGMKFNESIIEYTLDKIRESFLIMEGVEITVEVKN